MYHCGVSSCSFGARTFSFSYFLFWSFLYLFSYILSYLEFCIYFVGLTQPAVLLPIPIVSFFLICLYLLLSPAGSILVPLVISSSSSVFMPLLHLNSTRCCAFACLPSFFATPVDPSVRLFQLILLRPSPDFPRSRP